MILQFQITNITEDERDMIPEFCKWIINKMYIEMNTKINRRKIQLRINYLYTVPWISWKSRKYIDTQTIMDTIYKSITYKEYKDNIWKVDIDDSILIPGTATSISRLVRFINSGDSNMLGTGMFSTIENRYKGPELMSLWKVFILDNLGELSNSKIITR